MLNINKLSDEEVMKLKPKDTEVKPVKKLTQWKKEPKLEDLKLDLTNTQSSHSAFVANLDRWETLYTAPAYGAEGHKGSRIVPKMVRKQAEWRCPALSEPFLSTQQLFEVKPMTFDDVERAKQNALILNMQFNTQLNKVNLVDKIVRAVVKQGTAIIRLGWEYKEEKVKEKVPQFKYMPAPPEAQEQLGQQYQQLAQLQQSEPDSYEQAPEELKAGFEMSQQQGQLFIAQQAGEIEQESMKPVVNKPTVELCNIRNIYIDPTCNGNLDNAQFVIYSYESSLSDLKKSGNYANLEDLEDYVETNPLGFDKANKDFKFADKARKKLVVYEYWGYWDVEGSGQTTAIVASWVGNTLIRLEENPFPDKKVPFVIFNYIPEEDNIYGIPDAELLEDNQAIVGAVTRGMIDLLGKSANSQTGFSKGFLDATNKIRFKNGENYEYNPNFNPNVHVHTHTFPEIPASAINMVQMMNNEAEAISGVKAFSGSQGINASYLGDMLDITTDIPMYSGGFKKLEHITEGDLIIGSNGNPTKVLMAHEIKYPKQAYDLKFSNGALIKAGGEHRWTVRVKGTNGKRKNWHTVDTDTLYEYLNEFEGKQLSIELPQIIRPRSSKTEVSIDPYCLGVWLGDGSKHSSKITTKDSEIKTRFEKAGYTLTAVKQQNSGKATTYSISTEGSIRDAETGLYKESDSSFNSKLKSLGLLGNEKHIPEEYLQADYYIKLELLRGLMDTDGYAHSGSFNIFCQNEGQLKDDVIQLLYSMGVTPTISKKVDIGYSPKQCNAIKNTITSTKVAYEIGFTCLDNPFYIKRKASKYIVPVRNKNPKLLSATKVDKVLMRCLTVDSEDKLYAAGCEYTLTHNTAAGARGVLDAVSKREMSILRRLSDGFIITGRKIMSMNSQWLSEEEVVRVTNSEFIKVRRDDLIGQFDLSLGIATAEENDSKSKQLSFLLQTIGNNMGQEITQIILSQIAELGKMPDLAKQIKDYQPQPDPNAQAMAEADVAYKQAQTELLKAQAQESMAKAQVNGAKVNVEQARAESLQSDADNKSLDFLQKGDGTLHQQELDKQTMMADTAIRQQQMKNEAASQQIADQHNANLLQQLAQNDLAPSKQNTAMQ